VPYHIDSVGGFCRCRLWAHVNRGLGWNRCRFYGSSGPTGPDLVRIFSGLAHVWRCHVAAWVSPSLTSCIPYAGQAVTLFEHLLRRGLSPTQDTFTALIRAFIEAGRPEETLSALRLLHKRFGAPHEVRLCVFLPSARTVRDSAVCVVLFSCLLTCLRRLQACPAHKKRTQCCRTLKAS
jgi:pentatricopeptide repeat protein